MTQSQMDIEAAIDWLVRLQGEAVTEGDWRAFDAWLTGAIEAAPAERAAALAGWAEAPSGRLSHPRAEHLLPLMVAAGASDRAGARIYSEHVLRTAISAFRFN